MPRIIKCICIYLSIVSFGYSQNQTSDILIEKGFLTIHDHKIYYEISGTGIPVLLIHGGYLSLEIWKEQVTFLNNNGFKTVTFDDLGHGKTVNGKEQLFGYEIIEELRKKLQIDKLNIIGLSWGSMLTLDYALNKPNHIDKLILISPGRNQWNYFQDSIAERNFNERQKAKIRGDKKAFVDYFQKTWTDGPSQSSDRVPEDIRNKIEDILSNTVNNHWNEDWSNLSTKTNWTAIQSKTLLLTGKLDALDILQIAKLYQLEIKNAKWKKMRNVAHTLNIENPKKTNSFILKFLKN